MLILGYKKSHMSTNHSWCAFCFEENLGGIVRAEILVNAQQETLNNNFYRPQTKFGAR